MTVLLESLPLPSSPLMNLTINIPDPDQIKQDCGDLSCSGCSGTERSRAHSDYVILDTVILKKGLPPTLSGVRSFESSELIRRIQSKRTHLSDAVSYVDNPRYIAALMYTICW